MEPYRERVADVIKDEFAQQDIQVRDLPDRVQQALKNIERRIASDLEFVRSGESWRLPLRLPSS